ncbi:PH domain-containing protein [Paenibacillus sp. J2TS4]|uniref:PH domain-containing protein n=1 Tax=Paenibacillus sp. J2TS4 TaxID=2807194 RepID=UPI001B2CAF01|nr:PH domain-containing protein [Paenibacillus sp. J2TS4]GIP32533.1 hypothetical protein J2TS4_17430 [Paenibacillus sp. J2TS4]
MSIQMILSDRDITLKLSGWTAVACLRGEVKIPYSSIEKVQAGNFEFPWSAVKRTGISFPNYKAGSFLIQGAKYFLSYHDPDKVVILDLKGCEFDKVVMESEAPEQLADHILQHCP